MNTMKTEDLVLFFGKTRQTICRKAKDIGIILEHGREKEWSREEVENLSKNLYKNRIPFAIKEAIEVSFTTGKNLTSENIPDKKVEYVTKSELKNIQNETMKMVVQSMEKIMVAMNAMALSIERTTNLLVSSIENSQKEKLMLESPKKFYDQENPFSEEETEIDIACIEIHKLRRNYEIKNYLRKQVAIWEGI